MAVVLCGALVVWTGCAEAPALDEPVAVPLDDVEGDVASTLAELLGAARAAPRSGEMRGRLAMAYDVNGFSDSALATYVQAAALDADEFRWPYFAALLLAERGDLEAAVASVDAALAIDDGYIPAWLWRGEWRREQGLLDDAKSAYRRAEALGAGSPAIAGLAQIALREDNAALALELLEPVNAELRHPHLHRMAGRAYQALGRAEDARIAFARGRHPTPLRWLDPLQSSKSPYIAGFPNQLVHAQKRLQAGEVEEAIAMLLPWREREGEDAALLSTLAGAYLLAEQRESAQEVLREGLRLHPEDHHFHFQYAIWHRDGGDLRRAQEHFERALALNPVQPRAHEELAALLLREERYDEALDAFDAAIAHGAPNATALLRTSGVVAGARGDWPAAIDRFQRATERDPSSTLAFVQLARALAESGRIDEAQAALDWAERLGTHQRETAAARRIVAAQEVASQEVAAQQAAGENAG